MTATESHNKLLTHFCGLPVIATILDRLKTELPSGLTYHTSAHTYEVMSEALLFGHQESVPYQQLLLLAIAAAFHDLGFIQSTTNNEIIAADMADKALAQETTISIAERELIKEMILDTSLRKSERGPKQIPSSILAKYLLDADMSNLGRDDFFEKTESVRQELQMEDRIAFLKNTSTLMDAHEWYTKSAFALRQKKKEENLRLLRLEIDKSNLTK